MIQLKIGMEEIGLLILVDVVFHFPYNYSEMGPRVPIISGFLHWYSWGILYIAAVYRILGWVIISGAFRNYLSLMNLTKITAIMPVHNMCLLVLLVALRRHSNGLC